MLIFGLVTFKWILISFRLCWTNFSNDFISISMLSTHAALVGLSKKIKNFWTKPLRRILKLVQTVSGNVGQAKRRWNQRKNSLFFDLIDDILIEREKNEYSGCFFFVLAIECTARCIRCGSLGVWLISCRLISPTFNDLWENFAENLSKVEHRPAGLSDLNEGILIGCGVRRGEEEGGKKLRYGRVLSGTAKCIPNIYPQMNTTTDSLISMYNLLQLQCRTSAKRKTQDTNLSYTEQQKGSQQQGYNNNSCCLLKSSLLPVLPTATAPKNFT